MANLNHFEISQILGARVQPNSGTAQFGGFGMESVFDSRRRNMASLDRPYANELISFIDVQRQVAAAFEDVRNGAPTDALLFDSRLRASFEAACVKEAIELTPAQCRKVIFRIRKASDSPVKLLKAKYHVQTPQVAKDFLPVIESAIARIKYTSGQSIDEIFIRDDLRNQFARIVATLAPTIALEHAIQGALFLRKGVRKEVKKLVEPLRLSRLTSSLTSEPVRDSLSDTLPMEAGFFEVCSPHSSLYAGWNRNLKEVCEVFVRRETFDVITGDLWDVPHSKLAFRYLAGQELDNVETSAWTAKFVMEKKPLFNVSKAA
ncbi:hypothetical protein [Neorhodopirellula lusitana]|uniref:hypothetical protein n=1 Tax=Neorhodopirellula lusitana TaxID=445327 RepID=UPI0038506D89